MNGELNVKRASAPSAIRAGLEHASILSRTMLIVLLATLLFPALAAAAASGKALEGNPPLASLEIDLWPEYDRPAMLVILKGEIAPNVALPAAVSVRIPAVSGGPSAVAISAEGGGNLQNAKYEREDAGEHIIVKLEVPQRNFHIEFYDPIATRTPERKYTYVWTGDFSADRLAVTIQEPAGTLDLTATPALESSATGQDGLRYRSAQLGAFQAGKQLPIKIAYTKADSRTTTEILKPQPDGSLPALSSPPGPGAAGAGIGEAASGWVLALTVGLPLAIAGAAVFFLWRRRTSASAVLRSGRFCPGCGAETDSSDRFCSKCGAKLK